MKQDFQTSSIRYLSLGDSFLSQKTNLLLINMMHSMLQRQMEIQAVSYILKLKSTDYLHIEDSGDDLMHKKIVFSIRFSQCVSKPKHAKETFSKLRTPIVSISGDSPSLFYVCLTRKYRPIIQLEVPAKVLLCWESWTIPYTPKITGKFTIPLFLFLFNQIYQKEITINLASLKEEIGASTYSYYSDFEKRCLEPAKKQINKAFDDGLCALKFEYKPIKQLFDKTDIQLSFTITKRKMNGDEKIDLSKEVATMAVQEKKHSKSADNDNSTLHFAIENIQNYILDNIKQLSWKAFESFVCNLMLNMEYDGFHPHKAFVTSSTRDNGVDGYLELDEYGQKKVYFQAKRWENTKVSRPELQKFVGALHSYNNAISGFFVTTSTFTNDALTYANSLSCSFNLILIDKYKLCKLIGKFLL